MPSPTYSSTAISLALTSPSSPGPFPSSPFPSSLLLSLPRPFPSSPLLYPFIRVLSPLTMISTLPGAGLTKTPVWLSGSRIRVSAWQSSGHVSLRYNSTLTNSGRPGSLHQQTFQFGRIDISTDNCGLPPSFLLSFCHALPVSSFLPVLAAIAWHSLCLLYLMPATHPHLPQ